MATECVIDLSLDMRRRAALQRTIDESKSYQESLDGLIESIRYGPSHHLESLFKYIRSGASRDEAMNAIQRFLKESEEQGLDHTMLTQEELAESPSNETQQAPSPEDMDGLQGHSGRHASSIRSASSEPGKRRQVPTSPTVSSLLSTLKTSSLSDGEELLRRFMTSETPEKYISPPWSATSSKSPFERPTSFAEQPDMMERSKWHPALQMRSPTNWTEGQPQVMPVTPQNQGRSPEAVTSLSRSDHSSRSQTTTLRRTNFPQHINTDIPKSSTPQASSSTVPYLELVSTPTPSTPAPNNWDLCVAQENQATRLRIPRHLVLPLTIPDDSYLSRIYSHYLQGAKQMLEQGVHVADVLGSNDEVAVDLFFRERRESDKFDCASWACEVFRSYNTDVFARLGSSYMLTLMMRWVLAPTPENYQKVPDMMKPTPYQCMVPHIPAIETIPIAPVRDACIHRLRDWLTPLIDCNWSVNWHRGVEAAVQPSSSTGATVLTSRFMEHVTDYDNWSVGKTFLEHFPEVAGRIRLHD
ncbi:hypothetical protein LTR10_022945 [Elasticomyces elasticus]|uniref:Uncharacterized protein n=1 Tax=Exophiala sideris TaxID=1016849 RepID=A0ABR0IYM6_9EURO|nr:hypothetical protein LTR10_022945 [Elasticomyces elasticus]KAK5022680.1 hypothetical protein LTS07_009903 [Exophiala sideris]KAK5027656.1 hypothetical protein LTR13_009363 [Exophiala sideris]KAK5052256.1 hypothetical protein LTR69_010018 [Exophiala sideris]KAK5177947.1 hypothetical protein LTR44_009496 [Eurotiomycetes sp. CCFEE 6388]